MARIHTTLRTLVLPIIGIGLALTAFPVLAVTQPTAEAIAATADSFELRPGVLVDPAGFSSVVYLMNPDGGIDAVDCASGYPIWSSQSASKPLALYGHLLIAQVDSAGSGDVLDIALLDAQSGESLQIVPVELAPGVAANVDEGLGRRFSAASFVSGGAVFVSWEYDYRLVRGADLRGSTAALAPTGPAPAAPRRAALSSAPSVPEGRHEEGVVRINLDTEQAQSVIASAMQAAQAPSLPGQLQALVDSGALSDSPPRAGRVFAVTETAANGDLVLKRWDRQTGAALPDVDLVSGARIVEWPPLVTRQAREVIFYAISQRTDPGEWDEYTWNVFSLETGQQVARIANHFSYANFFLAGSVYVHESQPYGRRVDDQWTESPLELRGVDINGGSLIWVHPIRDTAYRGPFPP